MKLCKKDGGVFVVDIVKEWFSAKKIAITNVGKIVSGDINKGVIEEADTIFIENGKITYVGHESGIDLKDAEIIVDANGMVAIPGLIDCHTHLALENYAPMNGIVNCLEEALMHGVTTIISEGEQGHGLPRFYPWDPKGVKVTAILAKKIFENYRPGGVQKVFGGALVLSEGLTEDDFKELSEEGIWLIAEIGGGGLADVSKVLPMLEWARKYNFFVSVHWGPGIIPGSRLFSVDEVLSMKPDKIAHVNGGTTAAPWEDTKEIIDKLDSGIEIVPYGNPRMIVKVLKYAREKNILDRVIFGSDTPTGQGYLPNALHRAIVTASSLAEIPAEKVIAMATGNTARLYNKYGYRINSGFIEVGKDADIVLIDKPQGSVGEDALEAIEIGDTFGLALIITSGKIVGLRGKDTRPTERSIRINGTEIRVTDINELLFEPIKLYYRSLDLG